MFDLQAVWFLMIVVLIIMAFWQTRKVAERARIAGKQYCQNHHLQLLSIAMSHWKVSLKGGLSIQVFFDLNYSADGLSSKTGEIIIKNGRIEHISHWS
jgi:hypothetical protein